MSKYELKYTMRYDIYYLITHVLQEIEIHCAEIFPESNPIIIKDFLLIIYEWSLKTPVKHKRNFLYKNRF